MSMYCTFRADDIWVKQLFNKKLKAKIAYNTVITHPHHTQQYRTQKKFLVVKNLISN